MSKIVSFGFLLLFVAGCRFLEISDEQAQDIANAAGNAAKTVVEATSSPALGSGAGAGIGAVAALGVAGLTKFVLGLLRKKQ